jgi:basic membrane protein A
MKSRLFSLVVLAAVLLSACQPAATPTATPKRVVYLINGALGDNAFYDSGKAGIDAIAQQYGVETRVIEANFDAAKYEPSLKAAVEFADVIFVTAYGFDDQLKAIADANPDKIIVNFDYVVQNSKNTISSIDYIEEEAAYLAGVTAGLLTTDASIKNVNPDKVVGVVGGASPDPVIDAFVFAYANGAHAVDPAITVEGKYLENVWDDPAKGKQAALQLFDLNADVVFQVAAASGLGVLQAARERELYAIGVDTNQNDLEPGYVAGSMVKNVGASLQDVYKTIAAGTYKPGQVLEYGLAKGGVDMVFEAQIKVLSQASIDRVLAIRQDIIDGKLKIERYQP